MEEEPGEDELRLRRLEQAAAQTAAAVAPPKAQPAAPEAWGFVYLCLVDWRM